MLSAPIYLDANATTCPSSDTISALTSAMADGPLNSSSAHARGARARELAIVARDEVADLVGCAIPEATIFTSGGTEANNLAMAAHAWDERLTLVVSAVEHASVLRPAEAAARRGVDLRILPVDAVGLVDPAALNDAVSTARDNLIVSIQWANSETGVVQPLPTLLAGIKGRRDAFLHSDAVQAVGKVPVNIQASGVDALSLSGHKVHGPAGIGALVTVDADDPPLRPLLFGGDQQRGVRPGSEPIPLMVGLGAAMRARFLRFDEDVSRLRRLRDLFEARLKDALPEVSINASTAPRLPNTANVRFRDVDGSALVAQLDDLGIQCSQGSACSSGKPRPSHVLLAMGLSEREAYASVRFAFSVMNTDDEVCRAVEIVTMTAGALRGRTPW
ncbi:cysteine desulfurase family protein [Methylobacterium indicum]|uniref:Cysteine desulfurase n=1 Tax=Methylobacterium indicum TaxID=1775910 RepID=A0A8H8WZS3_9HYPH|nr:cysteine desulfurase family protein [Methylobacterium indicum]BCM87581.1 cysteine desulfurase [Methylobacterium indicum]